MGGARLPSLVALVLVLAQTGPALAHSYPDPGGHKWELYKEEKIRYFVPLSATGGETTRQRTESRAVSSQVERRNEAEEQVKEPGKAAVNKRVEVHAGPKANQTRTEGRFFNTYEHQKLDTVQITRTTTPYRLLLVKRWEERVQTLYANTYRITSKVKWEDPFSKSAKEATVITTEGPYNENGYSGWGSKVQSTLLSTGQDSDESASILNSRTRTDRIRSLLAVDFGQGTMAARTTGNVAFTGDTGQGAKSAAVSSSALTRRLTGSDSARSAGGAGKGAPDSLGPLLAAARRGADAIADGQRAWRLTLDGTAIVFTAYDAAGNLQPDPLTLSGRNLKAAGKSGQIQLGGLESTEDGLILTGRFRNRLLGKGGDAQRLVIR